MLRQLGQIWAQIPLGARNVAIEDELKTIIAPQTSTWSEEGLSQRRTSQSTTSHGTKESKALPLLVKNA